MADTCLIVLAKAPESGRVKTRLAARLGDTAALSVYRSLLTITATALEAWPGPVRLAAAGTEQSWEETPLAHLPRRPQASGGLGQRIASALEWGLEDHQRAMVIGTDCPGLDIAALRQVAGFLDTHPVAYGPASDGGYWAIALREPSLIPVVCASDLPWSTSGLLATSTERLQAAGASIGIGPTLADCDTFDDVIAAQQRGDLPAVSGDPTLLSQEIRP